MQNTELCYQNVDEVDAICGPTNYRSKLMSASGYLALFRNRNLLRLAERRRELFAAREFSDWEKLGKVASEAETLLGLRDKTEGIPSLYNEIQ